MRAKGEVAERGDDTLSFSVRSNLETATLICLRGKNHFCYALKYGNDVCEFPSSLIKTGLQCEV